MEMEIKDKSQRRKPREIDVPRRFATVEELGKYKNDLLMEYLKDVDPKFLKQLNNNDQ